ncbi:hypothetical protein [Rubrolithibacter danxiaensis]|uniref:hypothetical protein n=1 Tax=Rubrolithibacter danxiaensis TaxID=3390805 RepID=UPI003BF7BF5B
MKNKILLLLLLLPVLFSGCSKDEDAGPAKGTISISTFIKDDSGNSLPVNCDFFLLKEDQREDLEDGLTLEEFGPKHSLSEFTTLDKPAITKEVEAGTYILAVQIRSGTDESNNGRYSYKDIIVAGGQSLSTVMVFKSQGVMYDYEDWSEIK